MKYHEAIDMILDGCKARRKRSPEDWWIYFGDDGYLKTSDGHNYFMCRMDFEFDDWIVKKDGNIFNEYIPSVETLKERIFGQMRQDNKEDIDSIFPLKQIIADEVNEDWLDKKMLCFVRRYKIPGNPGVPANKYAAQEDFSKCYNAECPFCFPEDKNKRQYPDFIDCERCGMGMYKTNELKLSCPPQPIYRCPNCDDKEDRIGEDKSEKVTISEIDALLTGFAQDYHIAKTMGADGSLMQYIMENSKAEKLLRQKLEYLISLQDKNEL